MGNEFQFLMVFWGEEEPLYWVLVVSRVSCLSWVGASTTSMGKEFQSLMVVERKEEPLYWVLVVSRVSCLSWRCIVDVMGEGPVWLSGWGNVQVWRRCSSVGQPNASSMLLTLEVFLNRLRTKRAARLWTASILAMCVCEYGSQTDAAYSNSGRTKTL